MGRRGNRTLFSCTWKENKKNPQETADRAGRRREARGWRKMIAHGMMMDVKVAPRDARCNNEASKRVSF
jgi:hypothetical protein